MLAVLIYTKAHAIFAKTIWLHGCVKQLVLKCVGHTACPMVLYNV